MKKHPATSHRTRKARFARTWWSFFDSDKTM